MPRLSATRASKKDVGRYSKVNTGTGGPSEKASTRIGSTRVKAGGVGHTEHGGIESAKPASARVKGQRVRGTPSK
jgi:hypothetical protein